MAAFMHRKDARSWRASVRRAGLHRRSSICRATRATVPEATLLYQLVERYYPEFVAAREAVGRPLPQYVQEEFEAYPKCGRLEHGFLRVRCADCQAVCSRYYVLATSYLNKERLR